MKYDLLIQACTTLALNYKNHYNMKNILSH